MVSLRRSKGPTPKQRAQARPRALTAAAQIVTGRQLRTIVGRWAWQKSAWDYYDTCAELHYAINYVAQAASRAKLYVGTPDPNGASEPSPTDDPQAQSLLEELGDDFTAHGELIRKIAIHLGVAGESFLIGMDDEATGERVWIAASSDELQMAGDSVYLRTSQSTRVELPDETTLILRIYFQNPRYSWEPESHVRALLPDLARLQGLNSHILATTDSRLAGAGVLFIGDSVSPPVGNPGDEAEHEDPFIDGLIKAMVTPLSDRNSAAAVVPFVTRVPDEAIDKIKHVTFYTPFDAAIPELIELTLKKIGIGLNVPPEVLTGTGDMNHWSSWNLDESVVKLTVAPLLSVICQCLTSKYLRPSYETLTGQECECVIWFDTTELTLRPQKSAEAMTLYNAGLIGENATLRENGFSETDKPTDAERLKNLIWELAGNPATALMVLPLLGVNVPGMLPVGTDTTDAEDVDDEDDGEDEEDDGEDAPPPGGQRALPSPPDRNAGSPASTSQSSPAGVG